MEKELEKVFSLISEGNTLVDDGNDMGAALRYWESFLCCSRASTTDEAAKDDKVKRLLQHQAVLNGVKACDMMSDTPWLPNTIEHDIHSVLDAVMFLVDCGVKGEFPEDEGGAKDTVRNAREAAARLFSDEVVAEEEFEEEEEGGERGDAEPTEDSLDARLAKLKQGKEEELKDKLKALKGDDKPAPTQEAVREGWSEGRLERSDSKSNK